MFNLTSLFSGKIVEAIGWMLFHSLWQATVVSVVLAIVLLFIKNYSSRARYVVAYSALLITLSWSCITAVNAYKYAEQKELAAQQLISNPEEISQLIVQTLSNPPSSIENEIKAHRNVKSVEFRAYMQRHFPVVFLVWLLGVMFFLVKTTGGLLQVQRLRHKHVVPVNEKWINFADNIKDILRITKHVEVLQSAIAKTPLAFGYLKPVILLPISMLTSLSPKEIEAVIAHELAHIKRHDYLLNLIQSVIETLFFYHPAVWLISRTIREEREHSCDDIAIEATNDKLSYIKALAASEKLAQINHNQYAVAFSGKKGGLLTRVIRIKNQNTMKNNVVEGFIAASIVFASILLLSFTIDGDNLKDELNQQQRTSIENASEVTSPKIIFSPANHDSIKTVVKIKVEEMEEVPDELEQLIEVAYSTNDDSISHVIVKSLDDAFDQAKIQFVIQEAMAEVDSAMKEINIDVTINDALEEARAELDDADEIAQAALETAQATLEAIDIETIVDFAMESAKIAIEVVDVAEIVEEAMKEVTIELKDLNLEEIMEDAMEGYEDGFEDREEVIIKHSNDSEDTHKVIVKKIEKEKISEAKTNKKTTKDKEKIKELKDELKTKDEKIKSLEEELKELEK